MNRRGLLLGILAAGAAPAIVRVESLMKLWVPPQQSIIRIKVGDGAIGAIYVFESVPPTGFTAEVPFDHSLWSQHAMELDLALKPFLRADKTLRLARIEYA